MPVASSVVIVAFQPFALAKHALSVKRVKRGSRGSWNTAASMAGEDMPRKPLEAL